MAELKSCPFCGGVARLLVTSKGVKVMCAKCECQTATYTDENVFSWLTTWREENFNATEEAIEVWNRRKGAEQE